MMRMAIKAGAPDQRDPEPSAWAISQAATYFFEEGDLEGAGAGFDLALETLPEYAPGLVGKGRVALARKDGRAAVSWLERAYSRSPLVETAWLLGDARELAGDPAGAQAAWDLVVREGRRHDKLTLARFLTDRGRDRAEARRLLEEERKTRKSPDVEKAWAALQ
jgi:tetratricopeptide (TPR) repeat protein